MSKLHKRQLDFRSGDDVVAEVRRLQTEGYVRTKNWNLTQICEHLTATMAGEMDGLGFRLPWLIRATAGELFTRWILKTRKMPSVPTLPSLQPKSRSDVDDVVIIESCVETIRRCESFAGSLDDYPFVDNLNHDQWRQFMWIHAAHHLGFLAPKL
ncbi:MAG: DUF1569 domain-containing protein [Rubripirellula sp.]